MCRRGSATVALLSGEEGGEGGGKVSGMRAVPGGEGGGGVSPMRRSHLGADGSGVGVKVGGPPSPALPQQGAADEGQRRRQRRVLIVRGHVGDALAAVAHLIGGADVEGRVVGGAGGAETPLPGGRLGRRLRRRHGQRRAERAVQSGDAAGVAGKVLLRDGGAVRPILLTAVVLDRFRRRKWGWEGHRQRSVCFSFFQFFFFFYCCSCRGDANWDRKKQKLL